jgi:hypothetical protein
VSLLEGEIFPIREKMAEQMETILQLQYEIESGKRNDGAKLQELT